MYVIILQCILSLLFIVMLKTKVKECKKYPSIFIHHVYLELLSFGHIQDKQLLMEPWIVFNHVLDAWWLWLNSFILDLS